MLSEKPLGWKDDEINVYLISFTSCQFYRLIDFIFIIVNSHNIRGSNSRHEDKSRVSNSRLAPTT